MHCICKLKNPDRIIVVYCIAGTETLTIAFDKFYLNAKFNKSLH